MHDVVSIFSQPITSTLIALAGNTAILIYIHLSNKNSSESKIIQERFDSKADKKDTNLIFKYIREIRDKMVSREEYNDFKHRIGKESMDNQKSIIAMRTGMKVLLKNSGADPSILDQPYEFV